MNVYTKSLIAAGALLLLVVATVLLVRGRGPGEAPARDGATTASSMEMADEAPATASGDQAGGMPGMAMGDETVRLTLQDIRSFGVTFGAAEERELRREIRAAGSVQYDETAMVYLAPKFSGWAERLFADFEGQHVERGQPLLEVYSPALISAQDEVLLARELAATVEPSTVEGVAEDARSLLDSALRRLRYWDIPEDQIEQLLETGEVRRTLVLEAPAGGVVMTKNVFAGQAFEAGANLYMIADLTTVWIDVEVFESDVSLLREGMPAAVTVSALPGRMFDGVVEYVYPALDSRTRSLRARVALPNPDGTLKPGMYATVALSADLGETLTVPAAAVLETGRRAVAFVDLGQGRFMPRELVVGARGREHVQVLEGLEAGERVVTSTQFLLDSESNLGEVMRAMMAQMNMTDMQGMDMEMEGMDMQGTEMEGMEMEGMGGMRGDTAGAPAGPRPDTAGGRGGGG